MSNSSSMSFTVDVRDYETVFDLAIRMLDIIIELDDDGDGSNGWIILIKSIKDKLRASANMGLDPNTPVVIPSSNFDTYIYRDEEEGVYKVDTCNNHDCWNKLDEIMYGSGEDWGYDLDERYFFYHPKYDAMLKVPTSDERVVDFLRETTEIGDRWCPVHLERRLMLQNGRIICPECDRAELEANQVGIRIGIELASDIEGIIDRLSPKDD